MGRHSAGGSNRSVVFLGVLLVAVIVGWLSFDLLSDRLWADDGCESAVSINVTAAKDIAPVVEQAARKASQEQGDDCYRVEVKTAKSERTAETLVLSDGEDPPDVWIPESTMWARYARHKGAREVPLTGTSIASSPVVLAVTDKAAARLGWPDKQPRWRDVLGKDIARSRVAIADPTRDPAGLATLIGVRDLTGESGYNDQTAATALRTLSNNTVGQVRELFAGLPGRAKSDKALEAFPTSELAVLRHNLQAPSPDLVAVYPKKPVPSLDYPYLVLPGADVAKKAAARDFLNRLRGDEGQRLFQAAGLRNTDGEALTDRGSDRRTTKDTIAPRELPSASTVRALLSKWNGFLLGARINVLLDVSGSMDAPVPGTGKTRMDLTRRITETGLRMFKPSTKVGIWLFSTELDGKKPYRELLDMRPVSEHIDGAGLAKLRGVKAKPLGATGLYNSVLAAYRHALANWEAGRVNVVVLLTDGRNDYRAGITREQLLSELRKLRDDKRPVQIVGIGVGPDVDPAELRQITQITGGYAFSNSDVSKTADGFYATLSKVLSGPG